MADVEKVINGLECAIDPDHYGFKNCHSCVYRKDIDHLQYVCDGDRCIMDALALLKAQEPRVMTLEEVKQHNNQDGCVWFEQPTYNTVAAFVRKEDFEIEVISPYILGEPINHGYWTNSNYGKTWRCWTSRPDQATMETTPWE